jgi:hypothetical protein
MFGANPDATSDRNLVFVSYSHADSRWLDRIRVHLKPLERQGVLTLWDDTRIKPGTPWRQQIRQALERARVAVLMVTADFLASDFITTNELPPLLVAAEERGTLILPLIVKPCRFEQTIELAQFQAINNPSQPLTALRANRREQLYVKLSETIEAALQTRQPIDPQPVPQHQPYRLREVDTDRGNREITFDGYTVRALESGTIQVERDGKLMIPSKPVLRDLARRLNVGTLNRNGNPLNTRQLGSLIISKVANMCHIDREETANEAFAERFMRTDDISFQDSMGIVENIANSATPDRLRVLLRLRALDFLSYAEQAALDLAIENVNRNVRTKNLQETVRNLEMNRISQMTIPGNPEATRLLQLNKFFRYISRKNTEPYLKAEHAIRILLSGAA